MNRFKGKVLILIAVVIVVILGTTIFYFNQIGPYDKRDTSKVLVEIPTGSGVSKISSILAKNNLIKSESFFKIKAKMSGEAGNFKAGTYQLDRTLSNEDIINIIVSGKSYNVGTKIVVKEGAIAKEIVTELVDNNLGNKEKFDSLIKNPVIFYDKYTFLKEANATSLEGFLYPATYHFEEGKVSEQQILETMLSKFNDVYKTEIQKMMSGSDKNLYDIIKMASVVEEEAVKDEDRPIIASVFYNRLKTNTPLQSDAIIEYIFQDRKKIVTYDDLKIDSPYNSYKNKGLPPTPIANPGIKSIEAAINPANTDYLFFVTQMDGTNSYSKTYAEHLENVKRFKDERAKLQQQNSTNENEKTTN
ncbi:MAG: endolytic transglycosylase MltG [Clostridioides sp.]|jgi:UPF0755 protein|nr:endolytic transglycosylase MltG [Clostridioides sp.]